MQTAAHSRKQCTCWTLTAANHARLEPRGSTTWDPRSGVQRAVLLARVLCCGHACCAAGMRAVWGRCSGSYGVAGAAVPCAATTSGVLTTGAGRRRCVHVLQAWPEGVLPPTACLAVGGNTPSAPPNPELCTAGTNAWRAEIWRTTWSRMVSGCRT